MTVDQIRIDLACQPTDRADSSHQVSRITSRQAAIEKMEFCAGLLPGATRGPGPLWQRNMDLNAASNKFGHLPDRPERPFRRLANLENPHAITAAAGRFCAAHSSVTLRKNL